MRGRTAAALVPLVWAAAGCADPGRTTDAPRVERRDSAGIEIVTLSGTLAIGEAARVDGEPVLDLGGPEGPPAEQLSVVEDVLLLPSGGVAVADGQSAEVRLFDASGRHLRSLGGPGDGPGEFRSLAELGIWAGDTLAVWDARAGRLTLFAPDGTLGRVVTVSGERPFRFLASASGSLAGTRRFGGGLAGPGAEEPRLVRDSMVYRWVDAEGVPGDTVAIVPDAEVLRRVRADGGRVRVDVSFPAFGRAGFAALDPVHGAWIATNDRFSLTQHGPSGVVRSVRAPERDSPVDPSEAEAVRDARRAEATDAAQRASIEAWLDHAPIPPIRPAFSGLLIDDEGRVWVGAWDPDGPPEEWLVLERDGTPLGRVRVPGGFEVRDVRGGRIAGVVRDALDVPAVRVHRLLREPPAVP